MNTTERTEIDGVVLTRSWDELQRDAVSRGRRLRRRRQVTRVLSALTAAVVIVGALTIVNQGDDPARVRTVDRAEAGPLRQPLVFVRIHAGGAGGSTIRVLPRPGARVRVLSPDPAVNDGAPAWSPDGRSIVFQSERDNPLIGIKRIIDLYRMRPDGSAVERLTVSSQPGLGNGIQGPAWSPDGQWIVATRSHPEDPTNEIVLMRPDGSALHPITSGHADSGPVWSADNDWIAFRRRPTGGAEQLWIVRPDGTGAKRVVTEVHDSPIAWTPDGRVTFSRSRTDGVVGLFTVDPDGGEPRALATSRTADAIAPTWTTDGHHLAFTSDPDAQYVVDEQDGRPVRLGDRLPGRLVQAGPGGRIRGVLTRPPLGDTDIAGTFQPTA